MNIGDLNITNLCVGSEQVLSACIGTEVVWPTGPKPEPVYSAMPLTFEIISAGTINWKANNAGNTLSIYYSKDSGSTWTPLTSSTAGTSFNVSAGETVMFRGDNPSYMATNSGYNTFSGSTAKFSACGNIMSLLNSTGFSAVTTISSDYAFGYLFSNCTGITSAVHLVLPATQLSLGCYNNMFYSARNLVEAPELPATNLATSCYTRMFYSCRGLTSMPELPATTLSPSCYSSMFYGCTSLVSLNPLNATTLAAGCYESMFYGCSKITTAPDLIATSWFHADNCYKNMFQGCSKLSYVKCLITGDTTTLSYTENWLKSVSSTGTFVKHPNNTTWLRGDSYVPTNWTIEDAVL